MARTVRETTLATRSARLRLPVQTKPYWRVIEQGLHLGYRRRATGGTWIARRRDEHGIYREIKIGLADDLQDADGDCILDFSQAQRAARHWWTNQQRLASGLAPPNSGPYTVARAMADYLEDYRRRGGKASDSIESVTRQNILFGLGDVLVVKLTTRRLLDWHRAIAERPRRWRSRPGAKANFAAFERIFRLNRLRLRGPRGAQDEFTLAATAQNLCRLAKLVARPPPLAAVCVVA